MTLKSRLRACVLLLSVASLPLASASLNTASIIASAAAPDCIAGVSAGFVTGFTAARLAVRSELP